MEDIDQTSLQQRRKCEDDRGGVASGVGDETSLPDAVAVQLRTSIDCLCLQFGGLFRVCVLQVVDGAIAAFFQTPRPTQINDFDASLNRLRNPLPGLFVGCCEK